MSYLNNIKTTNYAKRAFAQIGFTKEMFEAAMAADDVNALKRHIDALRAKQPERVGHLKAEIARLETEKLTGLARVEARFKAAREAQVARK